MKLIKIVQCTRQLDTRHFFLWLIQFYLFYDLVQEGIELSKITIFSWPLFIVIIVPSVNRIHWSIINYLLTGSVYCNHICHLVNWLLPVLSVFLLPGIERLLDLLDVLDCVEFTGESQLSESFELTVVSQLSSVVSCGGRIRSINSNLWLKSILNWYNKLLSLKWKPSVTAT